MAEPSEGGRRRAPRAAGADEEPTAADRHVCTVSFCPICLAVTAVQPIRPDAVEHLLNASREFLLAVTSVLSARADDAENEGPKPTLTRIDIE
jgi:hypothetical protein